MTVSYRTNTAITLVIIWGGGRRRILSLLQWLKCRIQFLTGTKHSHEIIVIKSIIGSNGNIIIWLVNKDRLFLRACKARKNNWETPIDKLLINSSLQNNWGHQLKQWRDKFIRYICQWPSITSDLQTRVGSSFKYTGSQSIQKDYLSFYQHLLPFLLLAFHLQLPRQKMQHLLHLLLSK